MLFGSMSVENNELTIGGVRVSELVREHGSPLYVYDEGHIEKMIDLFQSNFKSDLVDARVAYASKAFLAKEMVRLLEQKQMSIDLVSAGEMYTAKVSGFDMSRALVHGNNKSLEELEMAIDYGCGLIVVDNIFEMSRLIQLATKKQKHVNTLLRVNPGVEAHTHEYIVTAKLTSKFGESIYDNQTITNICDMVCDSEFVSLDGFHCHIGSQVFDSTSFVKTIEVMSGFMNRVENKCNLEFSTLNLGGGFGVYYVDGDVPIDVEKMTKEIITVVEEKILTKELNIKELIIEPGRSIVSNAGTTLYTLGDKKETFGGKDYVFVNGGMSDNIRPALYQAEYSCDVATNMNALKSGTYTVAGKLCESGDLLIKGTSLQPFTQGDILAVYTTGAYNYSMASNYNRILKPAVVFVKDNQSKVVVKRETFEDLIRNDL